MQIISVVFQEMKRMAFKNRMLLLFIAIFAIRFVYLMWQEPGRIINPEIEESKSEYMQLLEEYGGELSYDKQKHYEDEYNRCDETVQKVSDSFMEEFYGKITYDEFWKVKKSNIEDSILYDNFRLIADQIEYIKGDIENRYLIYENGWNNFFSNTWTDYFVIVFLLICIPLVFGEDYSTDMYRINRTTVNGDRIQFFSKVIVCVLIAVVAGLTGLIEDMIVADIRYGISNMNYPLQSLSIFKDTLWSCTIGDAVLVCLMLKMIGYIFISIIIMLSSNLFKKNLYAIIIATGVSVFPIFMFNLQMLCNMPFLPAAYIDGHSFLFGDMIDSGEKIMYGMKDMYIRVLFSVVCMIVYLVVGGLVYCGVSFKKHMKRAVKKVGIISSICVIIIMMSGCDEKSSDEGVLYSFDTESSLFNINGTIVNGGTSPCSVVKDEKSFDLFIDPFWKMNESDSLTFLNFDGEKLYFLKDDEIARDVLYYVNISNGEVKKVYSEYSEASDGYKYLNMADGDNKDGAVVFQRIINDIDKGWVDGKYFYFQRNDKIMKCNTITGKTRVLIDDVAYESLAYSNGYILYVNKNDYNIWMYDMENGENHMVSEESCLHIRAMDKGFYFQNGKQQIYFVDCDTFEVEVVLDEIKGHICYADEKYIYTAESETGIYRYNYVDGATQEYLECEDGIDGIVVDKPDGKIYVNVYEDDMVKMRVFENERFCFGE